MLKEYVGDLPSDHNNGATNGAEVKTRRLPVRRVVLKTRMFSQFCSETLQPSLTQDGRQYCRSSDKSQNHYSRKTW